MTRIELRQYRRRLQALRDRLRRDLAHLGAEARQGAAGEAGGLPQAPPDRVDLGSLQFEAQVTLGLLDTEQELLADIDAALSRLDRGTFGRCEHCRRAISRERLSAVPYSRHCVGCARHLQEEHAA
jgi:RNA polymerase-binding transcription factor DksA